MKDICKAYFKTIKNIYITRGGYCSRIQCGLVGFLAEFNAINLDLTPAQGSSQKKKGPLIVLPLMNAVSQRRLEHCSQRFNQLSLSRAAPLAEFLKWVEVQKLFFYLQYLDLL